MTTTTTLQRLLKYPHAAVFDKAPGQELALRLRHPDGATWVVAEEVLSVSAGGVAREYDLTEHTVSSLANALEADGFEVAYQSAQFASHGASVLVEGKGDQNQSNGDHIGAFTSPLWAIMGGYAREVREAEYQKDQALRQMVITQAEGEWLDLWGMLYAEERFEGEDDADYAPRIPKEAFRLRVNGIAIEQAILDRTGYDIEIREPWQKIFRSSMSVLSGADHFQDDRYYSYFVIQPVARGPVDWGKILPVVHRNRAAGIEVYSPAIELPVRHVLAQPPAEFVASMGGFQLRSMGSWPGTEVPLGQMILSDNEIGLNHPMMVYSLMGISNVDGVQVEQFLGAPRNVAYASIPLSDGVPLGDENAILSRGLITYHPTPEESLSEELVPSDYIVDARHERVERIVTDTRGEQLEFPTNEFEVGSRFWHERSFSRHVVSTPSENWTGTWDNRSWYGAHNIVGFNKIDTQVGDVLNDTLILDVSTIT